MDIGPYSDNYIASDSAAICSFVSWEYSYASCCILKVTLGDLWNQLSFFQVYVMYYHVTNTEMAESNIYMMDNSER